MVTSETLNSLLSSVTLTLESVLSFCSIRERRPLVERYISIVLVIRGLVIGCTNVCYILQLIKYAKPCETIFLV